MFERLLVLHRKIMLTCGAFHIIIILLILFHTFNLGTVESEQTICYFVWPVIHLYYAFINYVIAWFCMYNYCEIATPKGLNILRVSKRFLIVLSLSSVMILVLRFCIHSYCRNWSVSNKSTIL